MSFRELGCSGWRIDTSGMSQHRQFHPRRSEGTSGSGQWIQMDSTASLSQQELQKEITIHAPKAPTTADYVIIGLVPKTPI